MAEIDIRFIDKQKYLISLSNLELATKTQYEIDGDDWQLDMRLITWNRFLAELGFNALYRVERVAGRYHSIEHAKNLDNSIYALQDTKITDSVWPYVVALYDGVIFRAYYGVALYGPMSDKAKYGVFLTETGAEILPLNEYAKRALKSW